MRVSTIISTYDWSRFGVFKRALRSVERQTYDDVEIVLAIDNDPDIVEVVRELASEDVVVDFDPDGTGLAEARNRGAAAASGDVYAFLDDDCVASPRWVESLVEGYEDGAIAVGGPSIPDWPNSRPWYLPEEFDWLVGGGPYPPDGVTELRNTYGSNISFRADVFDHLGGFDESLGKNDDLTQSEETELCNRMAAEYGRGVRFQRDAVVSHRVFPEQLRPGHLIRRAYAQGRSKRLVGAGDEERAFLADVLKSTVAHPSPESVASLTYTAATGAGYLLGDS
ncbi:glycosyltransferase [Halobacteriaceae archaeon GCM10025711]